jgi:hypothetical protein
MPMPWVNEKKQGKRVKTNFCNTNQLTANSKPTEAYTECLI